MTDENKSGKVAGDVTKPENGWTLEKVQKLLDGPLGPTNLGYIAVLSALQWMMAERKRIEKEVLALECDWDENTDEGGVIIDIGDGQGEREYDEEECSAIALGVSMARKILLGEELGDEEEDGDG